MKQNQTRNGKYLEGDEIGVTQIDDNMYMLDGVMFRASENKTK